MNKFADSRLQLGCVFVLLGLFATYKGELLVRGPTHVELFNLANIVGFSLIVVGALIIVRAYKRF